MTLYKHIIVPLDGSSLSAQALPAARMVAQASGAEMTLVRAYTAGPDWHADAGHGRYTGSMAAAEHDRVVAYLKGRSSGWRDSGLKARFTSWPGRSRRWSSSPAWRRKTPMRSS